MGSSLLEAVDAQEILASLLPQVEQNILLSAFYTEYAQKWLEKVAPHIPLNIVIRAKPIDFINGASNISAIRESMKLGWDIRFISSLHAKVYLLDSTILLGSSNLTSLGMHLGSTSNLELNAQIPADIDAKRTIDNLFQAAEPFTEGMLSKMEMYLENKDQLALHGESWWPIEIIPLKLRRLFCNDFPRDPLIYNEDQNEWGIISQLYRADRIDKASAKMLSTQPYLWLQKNLEDWPEGIYFGELTKILHDELADDPAPYRRSVKEFLANLLSYINGLETPIEVSRPRHSQLIKMR
jgi:hypothetical protein